MPMIWEWDIAVSRGLAGDMADQRVEPPGIWQATLDTLEARLAVLDADGIIVATNASWDRFAAGSGGGRATGSDYLGVSEAVVDDRTAGSIALGVRAILSGEQASFTLEYPCRAPDKERWFRLRAERQRSHGPAHVVISQLDITSEHEAADQARVRANLLDVVDTAVIATDRVGCVTQWNTGAEHTFGWTTAEAVGRSLTELAVRPADVPEAEAIRAHARRTGRWEGRFNALRRDGSTFPAFVRNVVIYDHAGEVDGVVGVTVDLTAIVETENRLRAALDFSSALTDSMGDGVFALDATGLPVYLNPAAKTMLGWSLAEIADRPFEKLIHRRGPLGRTVAGDQPVPRSERAGEMVRIDDASFICRDGTHLPVSYTVGPLYMVDGMHGSVYVFSDTTERRQMERDLRASREQALEASRLKSEFVANMSHEIRTPLNGVVSMSELMLDTDLTGEQREYAQVTMTSAEALMTVISDILDFSKITAGKLDILHESYSIEAAVDDVCAIIGPRAGAKGVELAVSIDDVPAAVIGDANRVRQVLVNLLGNAVKFTAHGEIVVRASIRATDGADQLRIEVSDTGIGIDLDRVPDLFQSFSQADATTTRRYGGTGLGLSIAKQLVELMGGDIGVRSIPGAGSTFWFTLPCVRGISGSAERPVMDLTGTRLLIVDDNATNRGIVERQSAAWGVIPDSVDGGPAALELLQRAADAGRPYELAVIDMHMPEMDGLELARAITANPRLRSTRLIMLSSALVGPDEARAAGIEASLAKPVGHARLRDQLMVSLARARRSEEPGPLPVPSPAPERLQVLVVEDDDINQFAASRVLRNLGYDVEIAANGREAIEMTSHTDYTIVFMDCQMPEIDGYTATRTIRQRDGDLRYTPIIAMTANAMIGDRDKCIASGMDDYIAKPLRRANVQEICGRLLESSPANPVSPRPNHPVGA